MDPNTKTTKNVHEGMKNSSANTAQSSDDRAALQGLPTTKNVPGLTHRQHAAGGGEHHGSAKELPFTVVTRSKRGVAPAAQKEAPTDDANSFPALTAYEAPKRQHKDPFGLKSTPPGVNPVTIFARTKQSARLHTGAKSAHSRLWAKGCHQDKA